MCTVVLEYPQEPCIHCLTKIQILEYPDHPLHRYTIAWDVDIIGDELPSTIIYDPLIKFDNTVTTLDTK